MEDGQAGGVGWGPLKLGAPGKMLLTDLAQTFCIR